MRPLRKSGDWCLKHEHFDFGHWHRSKRKTTGCRLSASARIDCRARHRPRTAILRGRITRTAREAVGTPPSKNVIDDGFQKKMSNDGVSRAR